MPWQGNIIHVALRSAGTHTRPALCIAVILAGLVPLACQPSWESVGDRLRREGTLDRAPEPTPWPEKELVFSVKYESEFVHVRRARGRTVLTLSYGGPRTRDDDTPGQPTISTTLPAGLAGRFWSLMDRLWALEMKGFAGQGLYCTGWRYRFKAGNESNSFGVPPEPDSVLPVRCVKLREGVAELLDYLWIDVVGFRMLDHGLVEARPWFQGLRVPGMEWPPE